MQKKYILRPHNVMLIALVAIFNICQPGVAQELDVHFNEQLAIGDDASAPMEYQFGGPRAIDTDGQGRIYVAGTNNTIRVFSPEGNHLATFGGRGRGPGEFIEIAAMAVTNNGKVIVNDARSFRITVFHNMGDSVATYTSEKWKVRKGRQMPQSNIVPLPDGRYAVTAKMRDPYYERPPEELDNHVVHLMPNDFSTFEASIFDTYKYMFDPNEPLQRDMATDWDYYLASLPNHRLALSHMNYNGVIYLLDLEEPGSEIRQVKGEFADEKRYTILHGKLRDFLKTHYGVMGSSGGLGHFVYQANLVSSGIFANNRWIVNVLSISEELDSEYYMEFINANSGEYLGYTKIDDDFTVRQGMRQRFYPKHLDDKNQLYYVDYSSEIPVLRVTKIEL